jgi:trk system potassium uptake protein TrkH
MKRFYKRLRVWFHGLRPDHALMVGYAFYVIIVFLLLSLPICWQTDWISPMDNLFIAVSVISTSGLTTVDTVSVYNVFGHLIFLVGIQISGLGYMTIGSYAILASKGHLSKNRINIGKAVLAMPESFEPVRFLRHIIVFTFTIELFGALILWQAFTEVDVPHPLWTAIFHSVTAFCTAGFSTFPNNLETFSDNAKISLTISILSLLGAIGFIVLNDLIRSIQSKHVRATLTTRIILVATFGAITTGTVLLFFDVAISHLPLRERLLVAFFHTISALTTSGFDTFTINQLSAATVMVVIILMILGASPSGTGGGLKTTTWSAAIATIMSFLRGHDEITFFKYKVPHGRITAAFAAIALYLIAFTVGTYCLLLFEQHPFEDAAFEVASALGTVGLSRGITHDLTLGGKMVIIVMMYIGRLGVVSLALGAVALYKDKDSAHENHEPIPEKKGDIVL